ncbi:ELMO/CED-12 family-domain-containing protein [Radiomyces spectabilis]|uniref:ELMO/CED-12 family-domain-containing protein n=1 Tax=Radiomyces spectabilis TaxID=64574 RepID=UPI00221E7E06|nr:ELMO/CED-12 family-domain-containing protein [Radiomyces spectabilis]KAI8394036.1 ELMO/CED-12 family-domain-containing protein [Radiomyces spectabilis]
MDWLILLALNRIYQSPILLPIYKLLKLILRLSTGTSEIYRICRATAKELGYTDADLAFYESDAYAINALDEGDTLDDDTQPLLATTPLLADIQRPILAQDIPEDVIYRIDRCILYSKQLSLERRDLESPFCHLDQVLSAILSKKQFPHQASPKSAPAQVLRACLLRIAKTYQLAHEINERTQVKYDSTNPLHEQKLLKLWEALMPDTQLEARLTQQWGEIGFQGNDPATDFRGMGMQGLDDLLYYAQTHAASAQSTFSSSRHPVSWYPYAIVGINITHFAVHTLRTRQLQHFLFKYGADRKTYSEFYCYLYHQFNEFWISHEQPRLTVMDFERKFQEFKRQVQDDLMFRRVQPLTQLLNTRLDDEKNVELQTQNETNHLTHRHVASS